MPRSKRTSGSRSDTVSAPSSASPDAPTGPSRRERAPQAGREEPAVAAESPGTPPLFEYRQKRDPLATNEPFGAERKDSGAETRSGRFVVHLHSARRRHYDLRLQMGRTLLSFAVPRGPSLDPAERRLAMLTENHPLEYVDFEEVIPTGNYGAGPMICWDVGKVSYLEAPVESGLRDGKIDLWLQGFKLKGRFALVRTKRGEGKEWLLLKKQDAHARTSGDILEEWPESVLSGLTVDQLPARAELCAELERLAHATGARPGAIDVTHLVPMLCRDLDPYQVPPTDSSQGELRAELSDPQRVYELKVDGVRIVATLVGGEVSLRYRNGRLATSSYPEVVRALQKLPVERAILDGEVVAFDERGKPNFEKLAPRIHARRAEDVVRAAAEAPVMYWVFDLLSLQGLDLRELPLLQRKALLGKLLRGRGFVRALDHLDGQGVELFRFCTEQGLEGVVAKRKDSPYRTGPARSEDWLKIKCLVEDDFVVLGLLRGKGVRQELGALALGSYVGEELVYRGRVGSGFDQAALRDLMSRLSPELGAPAPLEPPLPRETKGVVWTRPNTVVRVRFSGYTEEGVLRHAVYVGLRPDVAAESCRAAPAAHADAELSNGDEPSTDAELSNDAEPKEDELPSPYAPHPKGTPAPPSRASRSHEGKVQFTNRSKIYFPEQGYRKGDLIDYYAAVGQVMLPFLKDRPVMLVRYPDGIHGKSFFQWHVPRGTPSWIRTLTIRDDDDSSREKTVFLLDDLDALLHVANLGCIPLHVLACRAGSLELADYLTFDFDLGEQPFLRAVELAMELVELLSEIGLQGFPKTSGQGGLHVFVPMGGGVPFAAAKLLVELIGRLLVARHPDFSTMERRVDRRGGKLYLDTGQTGASRTIVAPYSVRATPLATVSTPLFPHELSAALSPERFNMLTVPARLAEFGDPFESLFEGGVDVAGALGKLERWLG